MANIQLSSGNLIKRIDLNDYNSGQVLCVGNKNSSGVAQSVFYYDLRPRYLNPDSNKSEDNPTTISRYHESTAFYLVHKGILKSENTFNIYKLLGGERSHTTYLLKWSDGDFLDTSIHYSKLFDNFSIPVNDIELVNIYAIQAPEFKSLDLKSKLIWCYRDYNGGVVAPYLKVRFISNSTLWNEIALMFDATTILEKTNTKMPSDLLNISLLLTRKNASEFNVDITGYYSHWASNGIIGTFYKENLGVVSLSKLFNPNSSGEFKLGNIWIDTVGNIRQVTDGLDLTIIAKKH